MEGSSLGIKLKDLREYYNVSQRELAKNICSQKAVSKIERGETQPTADILQQLGLRLGVDISYFFEEQEAPRFNYIQETKDKIEDLVSKWKYKEAVEIIKEELKNPLFRKATHRKFLLWKKSVCHFNLTQEKEDAIELLKVAMDIETHSKKTITNDDIGIYISLGNMYSDTQKYEQALYYYEQAKKMAKKLPVHGSAPPIYKLYYNLSIVYFRLHNFEEAVKVADEGINFIFKKDSLYLLGELYYQKGIYLFYSGKKREALQNMKKALFVFEEKGQDRFYKFVETNYLGFQRAARDNV
ncbi:helix-turn-helix domain-containing protein [Alteribacillus bidgolensis]|uniref:Transcriptional regulator, contains XRE-family HTH domain n=1 Tax=Alteribacillus bidgolensis TaxID=930129 RepID=A0A1G8KD58_9BACI|nr:helix-turn-helix domain-containing protein [Alteribacillus bidgolensis]SDI41386.1 Transcriptional regulator, contains XRE-family HTH domain [Alteribacillus bidgolensis]